MLVEIPGTPIALERPRFASGKVYDSQSRDKAVVKLFMRSAHVPCQSAYLMVTLTFNFGTRESIELWNIERPTKKDVDNLVKFYLDCGNGILWNDDRQIVKITCIKKYDKRSYTKIEITPVDEMKKSYKQVFNVMSPEEVAEFRHDFMTVCASWHLQELIESSETEDYSHLGTVAHGLLSLSRRWYDKIKKINSIKEE